MNKWLKILLGVILITGPVCLIFPGMLLENWGYALLTLIKGGITATVLTMGIILTIIGITELKE